MEDTVVTFFLEELVDARAVRNIEPLEAKVRLKLQLFQAVPFQAHVVVVVEIVNADNGVASSEQSKRHRHANKTSGPSKKNFHIQSCMVMLMATARADPKRLRMSVFGRILRAYRTMQRCQPLDSDVRALTCDKD
jgi:hypothetical protein